MVTTREARGLTLGFPSFIARQADHAKQIDNGLVDFSGWNMVVADREAEADNCMCCLPPGNSGIFDAVTSSRHGVADIPDGVRPHDAIHRLRNDLGTPQQRAPAQIGRCRFHNDPYAEGVDLRRI